MKRCHGLDTVRKFTGIEGQTRSCVSIRILCSIAGSTKCRNGWKRVLYADQKPSPLIIPEVFSSVCVWRLYLKSAVWSCHRSEQEPHSPKFFHRHPWVWSAQADWTPIPAGTWPNLLRLQVWFLFVAPFLWTEYWSPVSIRGTARHRMKRNIHRDWVQVRDWGNRSNYPCADKCVSLDHIVNCLVSKLQYIWFVPQQEMMPYSWHIVLRFRANVLVSKMCFQPSAVIYIAPYHTHAESCDFYVAE